MANIHVSTKTLVSSKTPYPSSGGAAPSVLRSAKSAVSSQVATAFEATASDLTDIKASLNDIHKTLRQVSPSVQQIFVTDNTGKVIAAIGDFEYRGVVTPNYFSEIHVGDPLNTGNPSLALFNAAGGRVTVGQNGIVEILDPFGADAAWIGAQADTLPVTGAADNGAGLIRLIVTAHTLATGDTVPVMNVGGVPNATGLFTVTSIDANHVDLQNSVFVGAYTSGGTINRVLHIAGAADNGSGLIRIQTAVAHTFETGDKANIVSVGGVPNATGQWILTVFDSTHFDLQGSTFAGAYTSGGTCLRYFAGMLAQTVAIGPSFPDYRLRAFADGSLKISNADIILTGPGGVTISLDPTNGLTATAGTFSCNVNSGWLICTATGGAFGTATSSLAPGQLYLDAGNAAGHDGFIQVLVTSTARQLKITDDSQNPQVLLDGGSGTTPGIDLQNGASYHINGTQGRTATRNLATSITTSATGVFGAPAAGQSNGTVVTGIVFTSHAFISGLLT